MKKHENIILLASKNRIHAATGFMLNVLVRSYPLFEWANSEEIKRHVPFHYLAFQRNRFALFSEAKYLWGLFQLHFIILILVLGKCMSFPLFL